MSVEGRLVLMHGLSGEEGKREKGPLVTMATTGVFYYRMDWAVAQPAHHITVRRVK